MVSKSSAADFCCMRERVKYIVSAVQPFKTCDTYAVDDFKNQKSGKPP